MERISEALQRARQQRNSDGAGFGESPTPESAPAPATPGSRIDYSRTRRVEIARETLAERRIVSAFEPCLYTDAFKILSTQVSHRLRANHWNTLAVTSPNEHEGKTLVAVNLAISLAMEFHQTALLVDADLRRPMVRAALGLEPGPGLSDYLVAQTPVEQLMINPGIERLVVLPGGAALSNSSELLGSRRMADLVMELKSHYRSQIVVFDLPPLLTGADVLAFAPLVEAALLVVEEAKTARDDAARARELLGETHLIGTVLNKSTEVNVPADRPYGYGYGYRPTSKDEAGH